MSSTAEIPGEFQKFAKAHLLAKSAFNCAYRHFWQSEVKPCSDETGWKLLEAFRKEIARFLFGPNRHEQGVKSAAWEIFRLELVGKADYSFEDIVGFVQWYQLLKDQISEAIGHMYEFHGDSFSDLVDSYPLAGPELVKRALASHPQSDRPRREGYLDEREVEEAVLEKLGSQWHNLICRGPNYVKNRLGLACRKCYLHRILTGLDEQTVWTQEERSALNFVCHYEE